MNIQKTARSFRPVQICLGILTLSFFLGAPVLSQVEAPDPTLIPGYSSYSCVEATQIWDSTCSTGFESGFTEGIQGWIERSTLDQSEKCRGACLTCCQVYGGQEDLQRILNSAMCDCIGKVIDDGTGFGNPAEICLAPEWLEDLTGLQSLQFMERGNLERLLNYGMWSVEAIEYFEEIFGVEIVLDGDHWVISHSRDMVLDALAELTDPLVAEWAAEALEEATTVGEFFTSVCQNGNVWLDDTYRAHCRDQCNTTFQTLANPVIEPPSTSDPEDGAPRGDEPDPVPDSPEPSPPPPPTDPESVPHPDPDPCQGREGQQCAPTNFVDESWIECRFEPGNGVCDCACAEGGGFAGEFDCNRCEFSSQGGMDKPFWCVYCDF